VNKGNGEFVWKEATKTGLDLRGEERDIAEIKIKNEDCLLFLQNNEFPVLYKLNKISTKN
jgi:hypothetical protein